MLVRENVGKVATFLFALRSENSQVSLTFHLGLIVLVCLNNFVRHDVLISDTIVFTGGESECRKNKVA